MKVGITAPAVVIALATTTAGCGGSSPNPAASAPATATAPTRTTASTATTPAPTSTATTPQKGAKPDGKSTAAHGASSGKAAARPAPGKAAPANPAAASPAVPPHLVGKRLDVAEQMLGAAHVQYKLITLHGRFNGVTITWGVCDTASAPGSVRRFSGLELLIAMHRCGAR
jgi:hypothetical protein